MSNHYSIDLRKRVIGFIDGGGSKAEASRIFKIGHNTVYRWIRERKERGNIEPKKQEKYRNKLINEEKLKEYVRENADKTLKEMGEYFSVSYVAIWKGLKRLKITHKKKSYIKREG